MFSRPAQSKSQQHLSHLFGRNNHVPLFFALSTSSCKERIPSSIVTSEAAGLGVRAYATVASKLSEEVLDDGLRMLSASS